VLDEGATFIGSIIGVSKPLAEAKTVPTRRIVGNMEEMTHGMLQPWDRTASNGEAVTSG
jgi:hypothetical protein